MKRLFVGQGVVPFKDAVGEEAGRLAVERAIEDLERDPKETKLCLVFAGGPSLRAKELLRGVTGAVREHSKSPVAGCTTPWPLSSKVQGGIVHNGVALALFASDDLLAIGAISPSLYARQGEDLDRLVGQVVADARVKTASGSPRGLTFALLPGANADPRRPANKDADVFRVLVSQVSPPERDRRRHPLFGGAAAPPSEGVPAAVFLDDEAVPGAFLLLNLETKLEAGLALEHGLEFAETLGAIEVSGREPVVLTKIGGRRAADAYGDLHERHPGKALFVGWAGPAVGHFHVEAPAAERSNLRLTKPPPRGEPMRIAVGDGDSLGQAIDDATKRAELAGRVADPAQLLVIANRHRVPQQADVQDSQPSLRLDEGRETPFFGLFADSEFVHGGGAATCLTRSSVVAGVLGQQLYRAERHEAELDVLTAANAALALAATEEEIAGHVLSAASKLGATDFMAAFCHPIGTPPRWYVGALGSRYADIVEKAKAQLRKNLLLRTVVQLVELQKELRSDLMVGREGAGRSAPDCLFVSACPNTWEKQQHDRALRALWQATSQALHKLWGNRDLETDLGNLAAEWAGVDANLEDLLAKTADLALKITKSDISSIRLVYEDRDQQHEYLYYRAVAPRSGPYADVWGEELLPDPMPSDPEKSSLGWVVVKTGAPLLLNDPEETKRRFPGCYRPVLSGEARLLHVPIRIEGKTQGVVTVNRTLERDGYEPADQYQLGHVAQAVASAVSYTRQSVRAGLLYHIVKEFMQPDDGAMHSLRAALAHVALHVRKALNAKACGVFLINRDKPLVLRLEAHTEPHLEDRIGDDIYPFGHGLTGWCAAQMKPIRLNRASDRKELRAQYGEEPKWQGVLMDLGSDKSREATEQPFLAAPIAESGKPCVGVIRCFGKQALEVFSPADERLLVESAETLAMGIGRRWALEDRAREEQAADLVRKLLWHEVRSPLRNLRFVLDAPSSISRERVSESVKKQLDRLDRLIDRVQFYARVEQDLAVLPREPLDLGPFVQRAMSEPDVAVRAGKRQVQLAFQAFDRNLPVNVEATLIWQCVSNLLSNAIRFSPLGGKVVVFVRRGVGATNDVGRVVTEVDRSKAHSSAFIADVAIVTVQDEGTGVPDEERERIFEPMVSIERGAGEKSSGMGLPLARRIARAFGGDVVLQHSERGALFAVLLPLKG